MVLMPGPLGQIIPEVDGPHAKENMAGWFEWIRYLGKMRKIKQRGECKPHLPPFVGNGSTTPAAADLAGQDPFLQALFAIEKVQVIQAGGEPHMTLVKDGGPLHGGTVQFLARQAVTNFRIHGISAHLVSNRPTKAGGPVFGDKRRIVEGCIFGSESVFWGKHLQSC
jgi:hypothetical protein